MLNFEKKFITNVYKLSTVNLDDNKDIKIEDFFNYFKKIISDSHIFVRIGYYSLFYLFFVIYFVPTLFFLPKKIEFRLFKILFNIFKKMPLFSDVFKFIKIHSLIFKYD
jgi:hypothetical protein